MLKTTEKKIILQLLKDARQPYHQIAKTVGITRQTVAKKTEQIVNAGLIRAFIPKLNPEKFNLKIQAYIFMREDPRSDLRKKHEEVIKGFHEVSEFHRIFGKYDSVIEALVKDKNELSNLIKKLHKLNGIRETETFIVYSTVKDKPEDPFLKVLAVTEKC